MCPETFDLELVGPFEKQLDLPALLLPPGNDLCIQVAGVGHKREFLAGFRILVANHAQRLAHLARQNGPVCSDPLGFSAWPLVNPLYLRVPLEPGDKENPVLREALEPLVIREPHVKDDHGIRWQLQGFGPCTLMAVAACEVREFGQIAIAIQPHVQLDGALGFAEYGPWKNAEAQIDNRGIEGIEFSFERELPALLEELLADRLVQGSRLLLTGPGKDCS